jgi:uncharacterized membrane protein (UPF0127 family)
MNRALAGFAAGLVFSVLPVPLLAQSCRDDVAEFRWPGGGARFTVEIADDPAEQTQGLMFRETLAASRGMLFVYPEARPVSFWMRNTLIPLDMVFVDASGRVALVHPMAVPGDLTPIPGPKDTLMVLEIRGGLAAGLGLTEGAELRHPRVPQKGAAWPCEP